MAAHRSILCHQETRKVRRPCFVCMKEGLQERFSRQCRRKDKNKATQLEFKSVPSGCSGGHLLGLSGACWTRKGRGQAEIPLSGRADAAAELEVPVVLCLLPLGTPTLCCKSQRQTVQLKIACRGSLLGICTQT